ncbi:MAG: response regulator transcription factor, partial [Pseudomonadota bacterium]
EGRFMNILLVEDEERVADFIRRGLKGEGWIVEHADTGEAALEILADRGFDVVVLDLMLPGISGQDVCRKMRARKDVTPVLMLTALDALDERIEGLKLGADDYLPKPFDFDELVARLEALHRRARSFGAEARSDVLAVAGLELDRQAMSLRVDGVSVELTAKEREILMLFMLNPNKLLSRERILNAAWGTQEDPLTNIVDVYIGRIRRKIAPYEGIISTLRGVGYRMDTS